MSALEIIGVPFSNYVRSLRLLCEEKGVPYTLTPSRPHTPEVNAIHPAGQIPVARHGDVALFETKAIATYIDKAFAGPRFIPDGAREAALVEQWVSYGNAKVDHWIMRQFVVPSIFFDKEKGPDTAKIKASLPEIEKVAKVLDAQLSKTPYIAGQSLSYADFHILPMLATAQLYPEPKAILDRYASLTAYIAKLTSRASFRNSAPPPRK